MSSSEMLSAEVFEKDNLIWGRRIWHFYKIKNCFNGRKNKMSSVKWTFYRQRMYANYYYKIYTKICERINCCMTGYLL